MTKCDSVKEDTNLQTRSGKRFSFFIRFWNIHCLYNKFYFVEHHFCIFLTFSLSLLFHIKTEKFECSERNITKFSVSKPNMNDGHYSSTTIMSLFWSLPNFRSHLANLRQNLLFLFIHLLTLQIILNSVTIKTPKQYILFLFISFLFKHNFYYLQFSSSTMALFYFLEYSW